jgi:hypothetical protein
MASCIARIAHLGLFVGVSLAVSGSPVKAATYLDDYFGGDASGSTLSTGPDGVKDIIGETSAFSITKLDVTRVATTPGHNDLVVTVYTTYAGRTGTSGTGYGDLFIRSQAAGPLTPSGTGPAYKTDTYSFGQFDYVFDIPRNPGTDDKSGSFATGSTGGGLFEIDAPSDVQLSWGSNPNDTNPGPSVYFRGDQAVEYKGGGANVKGGSYDVDKKSYGDKVGTITFTIENEDSLLGSSFWLAWAMTCANDIILVNALVPELGTEPVPLPATLPLFAGGLGIIGLMSRRRKKRA